MAHEGESPEDGEVDGVLDTPEIFAVRRAMAARLDCQIEEDVSVFYKVKKETLKAWSKRGKGPRRIRMGNVSIYPNQGIAEDLAAHDRRRASTPRSRL